jgi:hypothetical protein
MAGAGVSDDRLGYDLRAYDSFGPLSGTLFLGLGEAASCGGGKGFLALPAGGLGSANPVVVLNCDANISDAGSMAGDGALQEIPVHFIVIGNAATVATGALNQLPSATWIGSDPITGGVISGANYFLSMIDLLNQQLRGDDGRPVCQGADCLRLGYRSHTYYSAAMFDSGGANVCPKLHAIARPAQNILGENQLAFTENCNSTTCPHSGGGVRYNTFSDFANAAVDECTLLTDAHALNVIIYDVCERAAGPDGVVNTVDDVRDCVGAQNGRARTNSDHPYMFLDYARALRPRTPVTTFPWAAEEHEAGHAFGLDHACEPAGHLGNTRTMQTGACGDGLGARNLGFATQGRADFEGDWLVEVEKMIATARAHMREW